MEQEAAKPRRFLDGSEEVIAACIEVHRHLGPGLLESVYQSCLRYELERRDIPHRAEVQIPVVYKRLKLENAHRIDILVRQQQ